MLIPPWLIQTALAAGLSGLACLFWGVFTYRPAAVRLGHWVVSAHMLFYFWGSGGQWLIGLGTASFAVAGFVYSPVQTAYKRQLLWLVLALPPGIAYAFSMGMFALVLATGGM